MKPLPYSTIYNPVRYSLFNLHILLLTKLKFAWYSHTHNNILCLYTHKIIDLRYLSIALLSLEPAEENLTSDTKEDIMQQIQDLFKQQRTVAFIEMKN